MSDVKVRFVAEDEATEVARRLLDTLRTLQREERAAVGTTQQVASAARQAADGFQRMSRGIAGIRATGGVDAIARRVSILADGLRSASTRAESLTRLTAIESQLQRALARTNLTLTDRIRLERTLQQTRAALGGAGSGGAAAGLLGGFQRLQGILGGLGIALSALSVARFVKGSIDAADAMDELSQRTGVTTEALTVLTSVAEKSVASTESLATGLRNLARSVEALRRGNADAVASFGALGLTAKDLEGLSLDQVFVRVAEAQSRFADGGGKVALMMRLLGRSGDELIPTMQELANGGFDRNREALARLGALIGGDAARAAGRFNDHMKDLQLASRGLALVMAGGVLPQMTAFVRSMTQVAAGIARVVNSIPEWARVLVGALTEATVKSLALSLVLGPQAGVQLGSKGAAKRVAEFARELLGLKNAADAARGAVNLQPTLEQLNSGRVDDRPTITVGDPSDAKALRNAELTAAREHGRDVLAMERSLIQQRETLADAAFQRGVTSVVEFHAVRLAAVRAGIEAERRALEAERSTLAAAPLSEDTEAARVARRAELAALEQQLQRIAVEGETKVLQLLEQERQQREQLASQARSLAADLLQAAGEDAKASRIQIEQAADRAAETLRAVGGFTGDQIQEIRGAFSTLLTDRAAFDRLNAQAQQQLAALRRETAAIEDQANRGLMSQRDAQLQIAALERGRLPALQQLLSLMSQFADRVNDPALKATVADLSAEFGRMGTVINEAQVRIANLSTELIEGVQGSLSQFLGSAITQARSGLDALRILGEGIASTFQRIFGDILAQRIVGALFNGAGLKTSAVALGASAGALGKSGGILVGAAAALQLAAGALAAAGAGVNVGAIAAGLASVPSVFPFARGGYVRGPGTGTSDSIPARLSAGEYVLRAAVVRQVGVAYLDALNGLRTPRLRSIDAYGVPKFADGGLVTVPAVAAGLPVSGTLALEVEHSEDTILRVLETPKGIKVLTRLRQKYPDQL